MHQDLKKIEQEIKRKLSEYKIGFNLTFGSQLEESSLFLPYIKSGLNYGGRSPLQ